MLQAKIENKQKVTESVINTLVENGIDISVKNGDRKTPFDLVKTPLILGSGSKYKELGVLLKSVVNSASSGYNRALYI